MPSVDASGGTAGSSLATAIVDSMAVESAAASVFTTGTVLALGSSVVAAGVCMFE